MGFERDQRSIPRLPLFSSLPLPLAGETAERSGMATPPLHALAAVPFRWEQEPGKPIPCGTTALVPFTDVKCLVLPPCRLLIPSPINCYDYSSDTKVLGAWFGSWRKKAFKLKKRDVTTAATHVIPSSSTVDSNIIKSSANSRVWTSIYDGLKRVIPWKSKKLKKNGSGLWL